MKSTRTYLIAVLALILAAGSVLAWRQHQELIRLRAQAAGNNSADLLKRLAAAQQRIKALQDRLAAAGGAHASRPSRGAESGGEGAALDGGGNPRTAFRTAMNSPAFQKLLAVELKSGLDARFGSLFKNLTQNFALTPEQLDQFKGLLVQKQQAVMDALQAAREQGLSPRADPQAFNQAIGAAQATVDQQIQSALGAGAYAQYQQYEQTLPQRNTVNSVQQALSYSSAPLTDDQANQLVQILAQDQPPKTDGAPANLRNLVTNGGTSPITAQALTDAAAVLTAPQLQALQQVQQTQAARQQMQQLMRSGSRPPPPPPPPGG